MQLLPILASMENVGIGFVNERCQQDRDQVINKLDYLEKQSYSLVGKSFSFTSTNEIADILYDQLKLPYPLDNNNNNNSNCTTTSSRIKKKRSTAKNILQQLEDIHPLPGMILEHRKLSHLLNHYMEYLNNYAFFDERFQMYRVFSTVSQTHVPTGITNSISYLIEYFSY